MVWYPRPFSGQQDSLIRVFRHIGVKSSLMLRRRGATSPPPSLPLQGEELAPLPWREGLGEGVICPPRFRTTPATLLPRNPFPGPCHALPGKGFPDYSYLQGRHTHHALSVHGKALLESGLVPGGLTLRLIAFRAGIKVMGVVRVVLRTNGDGPSFESSLSIPSGSRAQGARKS